MKNNKKTILLILITITTLILLSTASATQDTNTTTTSSIKEKTTTTEPVVKEVQKQEKNPEKQATKNKDKIIKENKTEKNTKTSTKTVEVNDGNTLVEAFNDANSDNDYDKYIINLQNGEYNISSFLIYQSTGTVKTLEINGNKNTINSTSIIRCAQDNTLILNNLDIYCLMVVTQGDLTINQTSISANQLSNMNITKFINSTINYKIVNMQESYIVIIDDDCTLGENFLVEGNGKVIINLTDPYDGNKEINNENITKDITIPVTGNITLTNCQINAKITNNGNLTLVNCSLSNNDMTTSGSKTDGFLLENKGNTTLIDCCVENNTFNTTTISNNVDLYGAIVNDGLLNIINTSFYNNSVGYEIKDIQEGSYFTWGFNTGIGACVVNKENGNLYINKSIFSSNYAGDRAAAIYSNSNITIDNSIIHNNTAVETGEAIYLINTKQAETTINVNIYRSNITQNTINRNIYLGGGGIPVGSILLDLTWNTFPINITANISECNIEDTTIYSKANTTLEKSVFNKTNIQLPADSTERRRNNTLASNIFDATTISTQMDVNVYNNTFTNGTGLTILLNQKGYNSQDEYGTISNIIEIHDNKFVNRTRITCEYIDSNFSETYKIYNNTYENALSTDNLILNVPNKIYTGEPITITGTYTLKNPEYYDTDILEQNKFQVYINDELVETMDELKFTVTPTSETMHITVKPTISQTEKTSTIRATTLTDIIITPENYDEYIYKGALDVSQNSKVIFQGTFADKDLAIPINDIVIDGSTATFTNTTFTLEATGIIFKNMNIENQETTYPISNTGDNNILTNNKITITNTNGKTAGIYNKANNTEISYNTIIVDGPAIDIDHNDGYGTANTQAILLYGGDKNLIEHNTITVTSSKVSTQFGSLEAITNTNHATNTKINNNTITLTGNGNFKYGINSLNNVENITISNNNILVTGERYTDGIQIGSGANNTIIKGNTINCVCQNTTPVDEEAITYGITTVTVGGIISNNITIQDNTIDLTGTANYGIELYTTNNTLVENNTINVNGPQSMGIGLAHSPNSTITRNYIKASGDSTIPLGTVTEEIQPANVGIQVQQDSNNILIEDNAIQTYDKAGKDACINITTNNVTVKNNNLTSSNKVGDNTITTTQPDTIIDNNNAIEQESTTQTATEDLTIGESTTLTAQFYDDTYTPIGDGKAIFKVNGKTLRDNNGNVIYADVINGRAELPDVNITQEWTKEGTTIQAVYIGDDNNEPITTTPTTINVTKPEAQITLEAPTEATAGTTITLKATVTDDDAAVNSGRVAFKLNGKTLKNAEGKALYAEVRDGIATITYTIPEKTKAKEYTLTAVFTDTAYDRVEAESKLNVVKA